MQIGRCVAFCGRIPVQTKGDLEDIRIGGPDPRADVDVAMRDQSTLIGFISLGVDQDA